MSKKTCNKLPRNYSVRYCTTVIQHHSISSKLVPTKARMVFYCNYMTISYRFRDITIYLVRSLAWFTHHSLVWSPHKGVSLGPRVWKLVLEN